jgi:hypothetical protein
MLLSCDLMAVITLALRQLSENKMTCDAGCMQGMLMCMRVLFRRLLHGEQHLRRRALPGRA